MAFPQYKQNPDDAGLSLVFEAQYPDWLKIGWKDAAGNFVEHIGTFKFEGGKIRLQTHAIASSDHFHLSGGKLEVV